MFLPDTDYTSDSFYSKLQESPISKSAIAFFSDIYKTAKGFVASAIFASLRPKIEDIAGMSLNLRSKVDQSGLGRILTISELFYRGHLLEGFKSLHLLEDSPQQLEMDFSGGDDDNFQQLQ